MHNVVAWVLSLAVQSVVPVEGRVALLGRLPAEFPDMSRWELVSGAIQTEHMDLVLRFYVNPERRGLYQVMHYRIRTIGAGVSAPSAERLIWNEYPGKRPLRCFAFEQEVAPDPGHWREITTGTEYDDEMTRARTVLVTHRAHSPRGDNVP
jgi:hypothetical protein